MTKSLHILRMIGRKVLQTVRFYAGFDGKARGLQSFGTLLRTVSQLDVNMIIMSRGAAALKPQFAVRKVKPSGESWF